MPGVQQQQQVVLEAAAQAIRVSQPSPRLFSTLFFCFALLLATRAERTTQPLLPSNQHRCKSTRRLRWRVDMPQDARFFYINAANKWRVIRLLGAIVFFSLFCPFFVYFFPTPNNTTNTAWRKSAYHRRNQ